MEREEAKLLEGRVARLILLVVVSVCVVIFLAGFFVDQITTGINYDLKKRYSHLAVGWNKSQITVCRVKI